MKGYNGMTLVQPDRLSYADPTRRGNGSRQVHACSNHTSMTSLSRALGERSTSHVKNYWNDCLNDEMIEALSGYPVGTILVKGDGDQLIDGQTGWVKL